MQIAETMKGYDADDLKVASRLLKDVEYGRQDSLGMTDVKGSQVDDVQYEEPDGDRHTWARKAEYILCMLGYCVGLGNIWRFPYVCIRNGGGAFLIPFFVCLTLCGMPLFFLEVCLGQFASLSSFHVLSICPLFKGVGISINVLSFLWAWYFCIVLAWALIYIVQSFQSPLPWTLCDQWWNTDNCKLRDGDMVRGAMVNATDIVSSAMANVTGTLSGNASTDVFVNNTTYTSLPISTGGKSASEEFWLYNVLQLSPGLEHMDGVPLQSGVALAVASLIVGVCIFRGVKSVGKVVYVTATLPYILLTVLLVKGLTLDGAMDGIIFYVKPDFSKLLRIQTWTEASIQVFYSLGPGWGGVLTMASYSKFKNNCLKDSIILAFVCEGSSVFAGFTIFAVLGHMAHRLEVPVANFTDTGPGLAFVVYTEAITYLPVPQLWGVLFFVMLLSLGLDSQFVNVEVVLTTAKDLWPSMRGKKEIVGKVTYLIVLFLISIPFAARGGMYLFQLLDWYIAAFAVFVNGILELVIVTWIYGSERFREDIRLMIGRKPPCIFSLLWKFVTPTILTVCMVMTLLTYTAPTYEGYTYDAHAVAGGWFIASISFVPIPVYVVYKLLSLEGSFTQRLKKSCKPSSRWKPAHTAPADIKEQYKMDSAQWEICPIFRTCCNAEDNQ